MCTKFAQAAACGWSCQGGGLDSQVESSGHLELSPKGSTARELARRKLHRESPVVWQGTCTKSSPSVAQGS